MRFSFRFGAERLGAASARNVIDEERCASTAWDATILKRQWEAGRARLMRPRLRRALLPQLRLFPPIKIRGR